jgi:hypothetical protein
VKNLYNNRSDAIDEDEKVKVEHLVSVYWLYYAAA